MHSDHTQIYRLSMAQVRRPVALANGLTYTHGLSPLTTRANNNGVDAGFSCLRLHLYRLYIYDYINPY